METQAEEGWLWKGLHAKLIDGFTFTMPDTPRNQSRYPQQKAQKPGVGQPIARAVAILSLATAAISDVAIGPYAGKQTGETALLRTILKSLSRGDVAVLDRYYCSFMLIALMFKQGTQVCTRNAPETSHRFFVAVVVLESTIMSCSGIDRNDRSGWTQRRTIRFPGFWNCVNSAITSLRKVAVRSS